LLHIEQCIWNRIYHFIFDISFKNKEDVD
jgi:hypothetical protein